MVTHANAISPRASADVSVKMVNVTTPVASQPVYLTKSLSTCVSLSFNESTLKSSQPMRPLSQWIMREIILDMIEKAKAVEWIEDGNGAVSWGGYFYLRA